jgi:hypothetical protein
MLQPLPIVRRLRLRCKTQPSLHVQCLPTQPRPAGTSHSYGHYTRLGISRTASQVEVQRAFRRKAILAHPDKTNSRELWDELYTSFEVLRDSRSRSLYDQELVEQQSRDGLGTVLIHEQENHDAEHNQKVDLGRAREVLERALWGEEAILGDCNVSVLQSLRQLVSEGLS